MHSTSTSTTAPTLDSSPSFTNLANMDNITNNVINSPVITAPHNKMAASGALITTSPPSGGVGGDGSSSCGGGSGSSSPEPPEPWTPRYTVSLSDNVVKNGAAVTFTILVCQDGLTVSSSRLLVSLFV